MVRWWVLIDIFNEVRARLSAEEVARHYGIAVNRSGVARCPFHDERTASMKLYPDNGGFYCFGCHAGGTVIDLVSKLFEIAPLDAVRKLNADFSLGLEIDHRPTDADRRAARHRAELAEIRRAFDGWRQGMVNQLNSCVRLANQARADTWTDLTEQQAQAIYWRDALEDYANTLMGGPMAEQMEIFRHRKEVRDICDQILRATQTKFSAA